MPETVATFSHVTAPPGFEFSASSGVPDAVTSRARSDASAIGYANGWAQGIREARETQQALMAAHAARLNEANAQRDAEMRTAFQALLNAADSRDMHRNAVTEMQAEQIVSAAFQIAQAVIGTALKLPEFAAPAALARVLAEAPPAVPIIVRMNPADRAVLTGAGGSQMMAQIAGSSGRDMTLQPDSAMARGDAIAVFGDSTIDGRIAAGIERVRERLAQ